MTPEQIVRALAAVEPFQRSDDVYLWCTACLVLMEADDGPDKHKPDCPWRLAVEWVAREEAGCSDVLVFGDGPVRCQLARGHDGAHEARSKVRGYWWVPGAAALANPPPPPGGTIEG